MTMGLMETLRARVEENVQAACAVPGRLVVLLGVPQGALPDDVRAATEAADWALLLAEPYRYFQDVLMATHRRVVLYEEYWLLRPFLTYAYPTATIYCNNLYLDAAPVAAAWPDDVRGALLAHFNEDAAEDDATDLSAARALLERPDRQLYGTVFEQVGRLFATYPEADDDEQRIDLFDDAAPALPACTAEAAETLFGEADYLALVTAAEDGALPPGTERVLRIAEYAGKQERLAARLALLAAVSGIHFALAGAAAIEDTYEHRDDYTRILREHWGVDTFRTFAVYDLAALEKGGKQTHDVSQEAVIAHIVEQVEACGRGEPARDVFVTAPTGAGKSAMFQVPAIYLAEQENLLTIVISPLIALMTDQVKGLGNLNYQAAKTINSDIPPTMKQDVIEKVKDGTYHILYLSPETLLARSDVEQLIGDRQIGMIVIDEAHIVTTWGKQFRPDYWYLGDHIQRLRKRQIERHGRDFIIATFTATAIYHGREDMYGETVESLNMVEPITYLGYIKRDDIDIQIHPLIARSKRKEYRLDKFCALENAIDAAVLLEKKTLIYFPTVQLINQFRDYLELQGKSDDVTMYYGPLDREAKHQAYSDFKSGKCPVMLATKAFGMGIDIPDIQNVFHFAPTGNVCDYVQEIGRAARQQGLCGVARYDYNAHDFRYINQQHGMSAIHKNQLVAVIEKLLTAFREQQRGAGLTFTKKRNAMLLDAENFAYIFGTPTSDQDNNIAKVKTALLLIKKDFEKRRGYSPVVVRPIPLFGRGFFALDASTAKKLGRAYPHAIECRDAANGIYNIELEAIWNKDFRELSFPKFKFLVYTQSDQLAFNTAFPMRPAFCVGVHFLGGGQAYRDASDAVKFFVHRARTEDRYITPKELEDALLKAGVVKRPYAAATFASVFFATLDAYRANFSHGYQGIYTVRPLKSGTVTYRFQQGMQRFFAWMDHWYNTIRDQVQGGTCYLVQDGDHGNCRAASLALGLFEAMNVLTFEMTGGESSKLYIYMNQTEPLHRIVQNPAAYHNRLLEEIEGRHRISVAMLTFLYEGNFTSEERWNYLEDYFLGIIPPTVRQKAFAPKAAPTTEA